MYQNNLKIIHQFLLLMTNLQILYERISNKFFDTFNNTIIYTIKHDLLNPYDKTYCNIFLPWLYISINYSRYTINITVDKYLYVKHNSKNTFYETHMIHDRKFISLISNKQVKKITKDFCSLPFIFSTIMNYDVSKQISNILTDITLTANHICVLFKYDLSTPVTCHSSTLDTFVFKDIDIIK